MNGQTARLRRGVGRWRPVSHLLRAGGVRMRLLTFLVLVVVLIALLPLIVAKTPLLGFVLSAAAPSDVLRITARDASLSWISGCSLSGIEVKDTAGNLLLAAERISIDRAPLNLLLSPRELGVIEIVRPTLHVKVRPDGSNLEDIVWKLLVDPAAAAVNDDPSTEAKSLSFAVQLVEGTVFTEDITTGRQWRMDDLNVQYDSRGANGGLGRATAAAQISELGRDGAPAIPRGRFFIALQPADVGRQKFVLQADALSLAYAEPWLRRFVTDSQISGTLSGQASASWTISTAAFPSDLTTSGALTIDQLDASSPALGGDRVRLARLELPWRLIAQPTGLAIEDLQLRSDVGQLALRGRLDPKLEAARHDLELRGALDIARLAAMLPHVLRIRPGTTITSGSIELAGRCQPHDGGQLISGSVRTAQLAATTGGRPLRWEQPVDASFALRRSGQMLQLDTLRCDSKFLNVNATGNAQQFTATASFDLNSLAEQLGQFVDLSGVQLAGSGSAHLAWQQATGDQFSASARGDLTQLVVSLHEGAVWSEPQLAIRADAAGLLDPASRRPIRVDNATLQINGQGDELDARLTAAVGLTNETPDWPVAIRASGRIARWLTRARPFFDSSPWQVDGQAELTAGVRVAGNVFEATQLKLTATELRATAPGWNINEPRVEVAADALWDGTNSQLSVRGAQFVTSTISLATRDVHYRGGEQGIGQLTGAAAFRTDLARLAAWRASADTPPTYQPRGEITGNVRFVQQADRVTGELTATGQNLALASRTGTSRYETNWQEPQLTVRGATNYDVAADRLTFDQFQIQSNTLQAAIAGTVEKLSTAADVNINGTLNYDLAQVTPLLRPYIGNGIQLTGREQARFALAGTMNPSNSATPLLHYSSLPTADSRPPTAVHWSRRIRAQLDLPWSGANAYGLPIGAGRLTANLGDGAVRVEPLSLAVGEGRITAAPFVRFDPQPMELSLPAGPLITNVRISPEVSEAMLKYVAPVLAGATQSEGLFSMQLDGTRVPLAEPKRADAAGRLTVHSVRVVPGPLARELIGVAQQIEALAKRRDPAALASRSPATLLSMSDQQVNFRMVEGRVHHQNIEFQVGDMVMRSQGSVGLDETLALTLSVPIQDAWIVKEPLLGGLKGQSLQIPVAGTLTRPQLDQRAIANLSGQLIQNAAGQAIGGELNKALDKIFKTR